MKRLSDQVERQIIAMILSGNTPAGSTLPLEREFSEELGVGRPTLREALQRLERDGWITIKKGSATLVNNIWESGNLNIIGKIIQFPELLTQEMVVAFLNLRIVIAPAYTQAAVAENPAKVVAALVESEHIPDHHNHYANFDWKLHKTLARLSGNPFYTLLLNSFDEIYPRLASDYFKDVSNRSQSQTYYDELLRISMAKDDKRAHQLAQANMTDSLNRWRKMNRSTEN